MQRSSKLHFKDVRGVWVCRWVGDAVRVQALAKTVVKQRTHGETGEPAGVMAPDHLDILAELACGAQAHIVISDVTGLSPFWMLCH